jgi:subtilisin-like proprotein convertase family protein
MRRILAPVAIAAAVISAPATAATYVGAGASIPDNSFTLSTITISDSFLIADLNVLIRGVAHNFASDVQFFLTKDDVTVQLFNRHGGNQYMRGDLGFDDEATTSIAGYTQSGPAAYIPFQALAAFDGRNAAGTWTLKAADVSGGLSGSYQGWSLAFTEQTAAVPEPATWAMMIMGFGAAGAMMRQRRKIGTTAAAL